MREYQVRLTIRTNDRGNEPDDNPPYYADQEMAGEIRRWFDEALEDRDDQPEIIWSEFVLRDPEQHVHRFPLPARGGTRCEARPGCTVTFADEHARMQRLEGHRGQA